MNDSLPFPIDTFVIIKKIAASKNPVSKPGFWTNWVFGEQNTDSPPVEYEMIGFLMAPVKVGGHIHLFRTHRNGIQVNGQFCTSSIISIRDGNLVETFNSIYQVTPIVPK